MSWSETHEDYLLRLHKYCNELIELYHNKYHNSKKSLCYYKLPTIILSSVTGFLSVSNVGYFSDAQSKYISLFCGVLNLIVSTINMVESFKKVGEMVTLSSKTYYELSRLTDDISLTLSMPVQDRKHKNGSDCVNEMFERFELVLKESTILSKLPTNLLEVKQLMKEQQEEFTDTL